MVDRDAVRRGYDDIAETYAEQRSGGDGGMDALEACLDAHDGERVLDAGCGQGAPVLRRIDATTGGVGLDVSREMLRLAAERVPAASLVQGEMTRLPFAADSFDGVVAYWSLIHVPLSDHPAAIAEFARVLRPGGWALVCEGPDEWVGENPDWLDSGVEMGWEIAGEDATREQLRDAGFRVTGAWGAAERLADDRSEDERAEADGTNQEDDDPDWVFLAAELR